MRIRERLLNYRSAFDHPIGIAVFAEPLLAAAALTAKPYAPLHNNQSGSGGEADGEQRAINLVAVETQMESRRKSPPTTVESTIDTVHDEPSRSSSNSQQLSGEILRLSASM